MSSGKDRVTVDSLGSLLGTDMDILVYNPPGQADPGLAVSASKAGAFGIIDLEYLDIDKISNMLKIMNKTSVHFGVRVDPMSEKLQSLITGELPTGMKVLVSMPKEGLPDMVRATIYETAHSMGLKVLQEVCTIQEAEDSISGGVDAIILRGKEGGGRVSDVSCDELMKEIDGKALMIKRGGISPEDLKDIPSTGFGGIVLDSQLLTLQESGLPQRIRDLVGSMKPEDTFVIGTTVDRSMRFLTNPGLRKELEDIERSMMDAGEDNKTIYKAIRSQTNQMVMESLTSNGDVLYPVGTGGAYARTFEEYGGLEEALSDLTGVTPTPTQDDEPLPKGEVELKEKEMPTTGATVAGEPVPADYYDGSIAIVGIGSVFPKGIGNDNFWKMIMDGVDATVEVPKDRWDWQFYYSEDRKVPDKSYTKIGAFITEFEMDFKEFKMPPKVFDQLDKFQRYALRATKEALLDADLFENDTIDPARVGVVVSNSGGGELRDWASLRVSMDQIYHWMDQVQDWTSLPSDARNRIKKDLWSVMDNNIPRITEDSMPGSLANIASGRLANVFNFKGPNFITDAACASALAAIHTARNALRLNQMDIAISGGTDSVMSTQSFVEFCKIGALTPDGSRPFSEGANGFLMGEGSGILILKRIDDAVRDGDKIYGLIRGIGSSSDGKGKGITAPNPEGQHLAVKTALEDAKVDPSTISFIEAHGTSTAVGDVAEVNSLMKIFGGLPKNSIGLTSVKSQIGHLKSAAGAAGLIKAVLAIKNKTFPPLINFTAPNPYIEWEKTPFFVITEPKPWERIMPDLPRRCSISAFGFGGTNFHLILEEFDKGIYDGWKKAKDPSPALKKEGSIPVVQGTTVRTEVDMAGIEEYLKVHGEEEAEAFLFSSDNPLELLKMAESSVEKVKEITFKGGRMRDAFEMPSYNGRYRLGISAKDPEHYDKQVQMLKKVGLNEKALMALAAKGIFVGDDQRIDHGKVCFMFPGQGSQYINMLRQLKNKFRIVQQTFDDADQVMKDLIPNPLSTYVYTDVERGTPEFDLASETLRQTEYNQPSMLTVDTAMYKLLTHLGVKPDIAMGHSLGEYGALIASDVMDFGDALKAVSARGREMRDLEVEDPGKMASIMAGLDEVEDVLKDIEGYVIAANKNCYVQTVIAGESGAMDEAIARFQAKGIDATQIPVSHAFHSAIVAPAKDLLRNYLSKLTIRSPKIPLLANLTGEYYPTEGDPTEIKEQILDILKEQMASSVEWITQVKRAHQDGCRTFIEVGPKRALSSFAYNLMEEDVKKGKVFPITSNHPKKGGMNTYNEMIASLWSLGFDLKIPQKDDTTFYNESFLRAYDPYVKVIEEEKEVPVPVHTVVEERPVKTASGNFSDFLTNNKDAIDRFLKDVYENAPKQASTEEPHRADVDLMGMGTTVPPRKGAKVVISGASFGLPGRFKKVFDEKNLDYLIEGRNLIEAVDEEYIPKFIDKHIMRLDKKPDGSAEMIKLDDGSKVLHLAGLMGEFDLHKDFGVPESLIESLDITSQLAIAAGLLALKDAGIPLVKRYSQTSTGSFLPEEWELPLELQEDTGIIFASAFPGYDQLYTELASYYTNKIKNASLDERKRILGALKEKVKGTELEGQIESVIGDIDKKPDEYNFPRYFMFKVLAMGHSQLAQYIKAKGPNTQVNAACSTTTQAIGIAQDWIQAGRCKRVIVIGADDPASDANLEWFGSSLLALGALTPEKDVSQAALPFDRRRKGMIIGSGAAALILEAEEEPRRRGMNPIVEILGSHIGNSAFHGSRLDVAHIARSMDRFMLKVEKEHNLNRIDLASDMLFMSHETYTPARGGSSAAEVESLRRTFGERFRDIIILNTKGYTGHAFAACLEDPVLVKCLEKGVSIPLANFTPEKTDPQFEGMQLSRGGTHSRHYGLRLAAGFGSQLSFLLVKKPEMQGRYFNESLYRQWLGSIATTSPVELEIINNILRLKDSGRDNLIPTMAVKRGSSAIGYEEKLDVKEDDQTFKRISDEVVKIFSEKMGFPVDTIDIDGDLESDLGIDTVKQVELFGSARLHFHLPKDEGVNLRDYPTLRHVIRYILSKMEPTANDLEEKKEVPTIAPEPAFEPKNEQAPDKGYWEMAKEKVIQIVAEKTGYPQDMLDIDLDLEADLGIDTVKQVELFAMAREDFKLPQDDSINLQELNTLRKIIDYVVGLTQPEAGEAPAGTVVIEEKKEIPPEVTETISDGNFWDQVMDRVIQIVAEKTGYPQDMLELDLDLEADLGIDTVKQVELFAMAREQFSLPQDDSINLQELNTLRKIIDYVVGLVEPEQEAATAAPQEPTEAPAAPVEERECPPEEPAPSAGTSWDQVKDKVIEIVAEKTGYPQDMLELDLDLEADLGIDTVKQVELFAMAREQFSLPQDDSINLQELNTLRKIIDYVVGILPNEAVRPTLAPAPPEVKEEDPVLEEKTEPSLIAPAPPTASGDHWETVKGHVITIVAEKTGYPEDMLELDLDLEADLGIDTVKQVELFAMAREKFSLPKDDTVNLQELNTLRKIIDYVVGLTSGAAEEAPEKEVEPPVEETPEPVVAEISEPVVEDAPEPPVQVAPEPPSGDHWEMVKSKVIEIVAEKTGYPEDMLELDLDLEADLGIDTVKQVELFAMAREDFKLPRDDTVNLSDLPTLRHIIDYIAKLSLGEAPVVEDAVEETSKLTVEQLKKRVNRWVLQTEKLDPLPDTLEKPLEGKKLLVIGGGKKGAKAVKNHLGADVIQVTPADILKEKWSPEGVQGIVNLYPFEFPDEVFPKKWKNLNDQGVRSLFVATKEIDTALKEGGTFLSITRMGGQFGLDSEVNPVYGAVSGYTKAIGREYPKTRAICMDIEPSMDIDEAVAHLAKEVINESKLLEIGFNGKERFRPVLRIIEPAQPRILDLQEGMNILVPGGGTGITSEIIKGLSHVARMKFHIVGRTQVLDDVERLASLDEEGLKEEKQKLREELEKTVEKLTPPILDREFSKITKSITIFNMLKEIRETGSEATYHSMDVSDVDGMGTMISENGPFDGVIHAAGIEQSKAVRSKKLEDFDMVYNTKVMGAYAILKATMGHPLKFFISFSSVAGRFGNAGQVDYSAANDLLNKLYGAVRSLHPDCHTKAVGWSAWAGAGMASRGAVKTLLEMGGITFIPLQDGVQYSITETTSGNEKEVLYSGSLGPMDSEGALLWEDGIHRPVVEEQPEKSPEAPIVQPEGPSPLVDEILERTEDHIKVRRSLDGVRERFLPDHSIMGKMVYPGVMGLETFAQTGKLMFPDLQVVGLQDVTLSKALSVDGDKEFFVEGDVLEDGDDRKVLQMKLYSILKPKKAKSEIESVHYNGKVIMGSRDPDCQVVSDHPMRPKSVIAQVLRPELYEHLFHGDRFQVMEGMEVLKDGELVGIYHPPPDDLFDPKTGWQNGHLVTAPMQTECGFQTAGAYVLDRFKMMALPTKIGVIEYRSDLTPAEKGMVWVRFGGREENTFKFDVDFIDREGNVRFSYRDYQLKSMMPYEGELKGDHSVTFEEFRSPVDDVRVFRIDLDSSGDDIDEYVKYFEEDEWRDMVNEKMTQKRRKEHTFGRVVAKMAVSWFMASSRYRVVPIKQIKIHTEDKGKPYAMVDGERIEISISHSHRWAVCSVGSKVHGTDIELAEHRDIAFVGEAFTEEEADLISRKQKEYDVGENMMQTLFFSAKESYLKKTGLGLSVDLKSVQCTEVVKLPNKGGISFEVFINHGDEEGKVQAHIPSAYVLTICA